MDKFFYAVIGNPPYQEENDSNGRKPPIYHHFMDGAYEVAEKVELITPARFLFNAGQTPKEWNRKMLADPHLKVLEYEPNPQKVFPNTEIKGGVAVTYRDDGFDFGAIGLYVPYSELEGALGKVQNASSEYLSSLVTGAVPYKFTDQVRADHPELVKAIGRSFDLRTNILDKLYERLFFDTAEEVDNAIAIYGLHIGKRKCLWIDASYVDVPENFDSFKVLLPKASGNGDFGEKLGEMAVAAKNVGHTQSFVSMGNFEREDDAYTLCKYLKTKFARALLGTLKVTPDITPRVWGHVPLQDFTASSDIDWSEDVASIDRQLYAKYGLSPEEVDFIESHVKEMS